MKTTALVLSAAMAGLPACVAAQTHMQVQASLATTTTVPFKLADRHVYVKAEVDGQTFAFVFDTAGAATLTAGARDALGLPVVAKAQIHGAGNDAETMDVVRPKVASIGDATLRNAYFLVLRRDLGLASPYPGVPFGGILGREFFGTLVLTIDYANSKFTLTNPSIFHPNPAQEAIAMTMRDGVFPNVEATVDGVTGTFDLDAGSSQGLMLTRAFANANGIVEKMPKTVDVDAARGVGGEIGGTAGRVATFKLGSVSFANPIAVVTNASGGAFATPGLAGNIGGEILRRFTVTFDAPEHTVYLARDSAYKDPFTFTRSGLFATRRDGKTIVTRVVTGSPAQTAGVRPGDVLVALDGTPLAALTADQVHDFWLRPAGTSVRAKLERDGSPVAVTLTLRDLL